jgi:hypothetical protein
MLRTALVILALLVAPALAAHDPKAMDVLAKASSAMGGPAWNKVKFVRSKSEIATSGLKGTAESWSDAKTGAYASRYDLGSFKGADGYDGKQVWTQDSSGQVVIVGSEDAVRGAVNNAYQNVHGYWHAEKWLAEILYSGAKTEGGRAFDVVRITPQGGRPFDFWIDAQTHIIDRMIEQTATLTNTAFMSDYRRVSGALIAYAIRQTTGEEKYDTFIQATEITFDSKAPKGVFAPPPLPPADFGFNTAEKRTTLPFELINNHMYVRVKLNGRPYEFLFDTGGRNVITPSVAKELGLGSAGALRGGGVGEKAEDVALTKVKHMEVGSAYLNDQTFAIFALESFGAIEGRPITGIFGYEVFKRFVVETNYEASTITLIDPNGFAYKGAGVRVPFEFDESTPAVAGEIDGIAGRFTLDTGSRASLDLSGPFVKDHDLVKHYGANVQGVTGWGVGGPARSWIVRAKKFSFGGLSVDAPVVGLSQQTKGSYSNIYVAGNVGAGVLKKFNIVWNYGTHELFFEKNANYEKRDVYDRAGLWANLGDGVFEVVDVIAGTPAAHSGLKAGDQILSANGMDAGKGISLPGFRALLRGPVGSRIKLDVVRGDKRLNLPLTLRDLV